MSGDENIFRRAWLSLLTYPRPATFPVLTPLETQSLAPLDLIPTP